MGLLMDIYIIILFEGRRKKLLRRGVYKRNGDKKN